MAREIVRVFERRGDGRLEGVFVRENKESIGKSECNKEYMYGRTGKSV